MDPREAQTMFAKILLEKIRRDPHPSTTQMTILEQSIPPDMLGDYVEVLFEKVITDQPPSVPMLRRIQRVTQMM